MNASAHTDALEQPQIHIDVGNFTARLNVDESSLSRVRRTGVEGGKVGVVTRVIRCNLLTLISGDDQVLVGFEAKDAILAPVVGLSPHSWHEDVARPLTHRPEGLYFRPDSGTSVFVVYRSRDDARRLQTEDDVFFCVPACEYHTLSCIEDHPLPVSLRRVSVSAGHQ